MKKTLGSWSGMRKYLEKEMPADSLKGRVRYNCTTYVGMDGCHIFEVFFDGELFKQFSWETVNSYFIRMGLSEKQHPMDIADYWADYRGLLAQHPMDARTEYTDGEFAQALEIYRNSGIKESRESNDPIVKMFALLDRRTGRRALEKLADSLEDWPGWLREVYRFRMEAEADHTRQRRNDNGIQ